MHVQQYIKKKKNAKLLGKKQMKNCERYYVWILRLIFHSDKTDKDLWKEDLRPF